MPVEIRQVPLYTELPVGQEVMFSVRHNTIVATMYNVKFVAKVYISDTFITWTSDQHIGDFKTTPNNTGVGIFNFRPIIESYVSPDYEGSTNLTGSTYKTSTKTHPLHLIDKLSLNDNSVRYFAVQFLIEYSIGPDDDVNLDLDELVNGIKYTIFNGVLQYDDVLTEASLPGGFPINYGYDLEVNDFIPFGLSGDAKLLSNAPREQYARLTDYGTFPFLQFMPDITNFVNSFEIKCFNPSGVQLGATETIDNNQANGGNGLSGQNSFNNIMYFGGFPANLRGWNSVFAQQVIAGADIAYYTVKPRLFIVTPSIEPYTIHIMCPNERGYEGIRLTWLNQWGGWDYYTFNMKSTKSITTNKSSWTQLGGTWNETSYKISGYKGGTKNFRVNATERIKLNTDFVAEAEGVWFEELINSPEVYIVNEYSEDKTNAITNKYVEPVRLTTSSYIKKTRANDRLMQYTIEIEKSKIKRTQAV